MTALSSRRSDSIPTDTPEQIIVFPVSHPDVTTMLKFQHFTYDIRMTCTSDTGLIMCILSRFRLLVSFFGPSNSLLLNASNCTFITRREGYANISCARVDKVSPPSPTIIPA